jgi:hypothetical protein
LYLQLFDWDAESFEHFDSVEKTVLTTEHDALDAALLCELRALGTRRICGVKRTTVRSPVPVSGDLGESVRLGMEKFRLREEFPIGTPDFADVVCPAGRHPVVSIGDDLSADDHKGADL